MVYTEAETAILCQLSYYDIGQVDGPLFSLETMLRHFSALLKNDLGEAFHTAIEGLKEKVAGKDYTIVKATNAANGSGFAAFAVKDPTGAVTVSCRGTEFEQGNDVATDIAIGTMDDNAQYADMEQFMKELDREGYETYNFIGHSLGGNLAMHGAISYGDPDKVGEVVALNAPGFNDAYWRTNRNKIAAVDQKIISYQTTTDPVSSMLKPPGEVRIIKSSIIWSLFDPFSGHGLNAYALTANGTFVESKFGIKHPFAQRIGKYVSGISAAFSNGMFFFLFSLVNRSNMQQCRDFTSEAETALVNTAKEVEEEHFLNLANRDVGDRGQAVLNSLAVEVYILGINQYLRNLIETNEASVADIKRIFTEARALDQNYATKIKTLTSELSTSVTGSVMKCAERITVKEPT